MTRAQHRRRVKTSLRAQKSVRGHRLKCVNNLYMSRSMRRMKARRWLARGGPFIKRITLSRDTAPGAIRASIGIEARRASCA